MFKLPSKATLVLTLVAGVLVVLNTTTFKLGAPWFTGVAIALLFLASMGIGPLLGLAWRTALNLTQAESAFVTAFLTFLQLLQQTITMSVGLHAVIAGVLVVAGGLGFGPSTITEVRSERAARRAVHARR